MSSAYGTVSTSPRPATANMHSAMTQWKRLSIRGAEVELVSAGNVALALGSNVLCEGGEAAVTGGALVYRPAGEMTTQWTLSLDRIDRLVREPRGYLASGKIDIVVRGAKEDTCDRRGTRRWTCQVCEETNDADGKGGKCAVCGSIQHGPLLLLPSAETASLAAWMCDVCGGENDGGRERCGECGFPAHKHSSPDAKMPSAQTEEVYRLSFRSGGSTVFFAKLEAALAQHRQQSPPPLSDPEMAHLTVGISGLMRRSELQRQATDASLSAAFSDLDALMRTAGDLVRLAGQISTKLAAATVRSQSDQNDGVLSPVEQSQLWSLIDSLGMMSGEDLHDLHDPHDQHDHQDTTTAVPSTFVTLARDMSSLLTRMIETTGTRAYSLADVYCIYNRTRGGNCLVSPSDVLRAAQLLAPLQLPVRLHRFTTRGMLCLVPAADLAPATLHAHLHRILAGKHEKRHGTVRSIDDCWVTAVDLAEHLHISIPLAAEQLAMAESTGQLVRDGKCRDIVAFYPNRLLQMSADEVGGRGKT